MLGSSVLLFGLLFTWATPIWLISVGAAAGLVVLAAAYGVLFLISRRAAEWALSTLREGVLLPISYLAIALAAFALAGPLLVPNLPYRALIASVSRLSAVGQRDYEIVVPPATHDYKLKPIVVRLDELNSFSAECDQAADHRNQHHLQLWAVARGAFVAGRKIYLDQARRAGKRPAERL